MNENDELLDLVDANDIVTGTIHRGDMVKAGYSSEDIYVRFASAFIINEKHEVWVPIRGTHKRIAPGGCDFSVSEHVLSGETYSDAIERAFREEAGMEIHAQDLTSIGKLSDIDGKHIHEAVFGCLIHGTKIPEWSTEEFSSAGWMQLPDLEELLISGPPTKPALLPAFKLLKAQIDTLS